MPHFNYKQSHCTGSHPNWTPEGEGYGGDYSGGGYNTYTPYLIGNGNQYAGCNCHCESRYDSFYGIIYQYNQYEYCPSLGWNDANNDQECQQECRAHCTQYGTDHTTLRSLPRPGISPYPRGGQRRGNRMSSPMGGYKQGGRITKGRFAGRTQRSSKSKPYK